MAMLATLEGIEKNRGGLLSACLGACNAVGVTVRGCLGASMAQDWAPGIAAIKDENERMLASQPAYFLGVDAPGIVAIGIRDGQSRNIDNYGGWFYPVQQFETMFRRKAHDYPELDDEQVSTLVYYEFLAQFPKPYDYERAVVYDMKIKALREFINGKGWYAGIRKTEAEQSRTGQAQAASQSASAASQAYKKAMEKRAQEAAAIEEQYTAEVEETAERLPETKQNLTKSETGSGSSILPILGIAAAAALAFMG